VDFQLKETTENEPRVCNYCLCTRETNYRESGTNKQWNLPKLTQSQKKIHHYNSKGVFFTTVSN